MTTRLPASLDELRGRRAARWIRESTAGQADNFGPDAQREQEDTAIERWGLVEAGVGWQVAHSGRTIASTSQWAEMVAAAGDTYDVLVVGYVSRFARDLRTAVNARHELHLAGAAILFADERVLSSDEDEWERWAREAVEAEAYSRRLGKRIREGYAAKRRRLGIPGGNRAPLGTVRTGRELCISHASLAVVRRAYDLAAGGLTDREVAVAMDLAPKHVAEILTNRFYRGRLSDGSPSALGALVDVVTWERVQALRARYSRRHRGSVRRRRYGLAGILACAACGRRLIGHSGRYRHPEACPPFVARAIRRRRAGRGYDHRGGRGQSYAVELYEEAVGLAFAHVATSTSLKVEAIAAATSPEQPAGDVLALARISATRDAAALRFARDRDMGRLEATLRRLDVEEEGARASNNITTPTAAEARAYLEDLPALWRDTDTEGRRAIAEAVFERIDVLGVTDYSFVLTADAKAHGWDVAFGPDALVRSIGHSGRGERAWASHTDLSVHAIRLSRVETSDTQVAG